MMEKNSRDMNMEHNTPSSKDSGGLSKRKKRVLIVCPHPDDGEVLAQQLIVHSLKCGYEVIELLATCDEYGTTRDDFKGRRIQRIRRAEMRAAAKAYGVDENKKPLVKLAWMNYIDIHVPFNKHSVSRLKDFILRVKPDIIIGPDPFLEFDGHPDHINTGLNYYFALKKIAKQDRPKLMLFFQTTKPDFFLPVISTDIIQKARSMHRSQFTPLMIKVMKYMSVVFSLINAPKTGAKLVQGYRRVSFRNEDHSLKGLQKLFYYILGKPGNEPTKLIPPTPKELGLEVNADRTDEIEFDQYMF
ncbi:MAG: PIG-L deacetylase family protein [Promethearchaeota archaeon]